MKPLHKTCNIQLGIVKEGLIESPPPAPSSATLREWFAGLALANPVLMNHVPSEKRASEAVRFADELLHALAAPRAIDTNSCLAPPASEMEVWEKLVANQSQDTVPACPNSKPSEQTRSRLTIPPPSRK